MSLTHARDVPADPINASDPKCIITTKYLKNMEARLETLHYFKNNKPKHCMLTNVLIREEGCISECIFVMDDVSYVMQGSITTGDDTFYLRALYSDLCSKTRVSDC